MILLPFETIIFTTKLDGQELNNNLKYCLTSEKPQSKKKKQNKYKGSFNGEEFKIQRKNKYKNSFLPIIKGKIISQDNSTKIKVNLRLDNSVLGFLIMWCSLALIMLYSFSKTDPNIENASLIKLMPLGFILFAYVLVIIFFNIERSISKSYLKRIFNAQIIE